MHKIPTLFQRETIDGRPGRHVTREVTPGCEWVIAGEGVPTRKYDGTCCLIRDGKLYKRREFKDGKPTPTDFEETEYDAKTGKHFGWVPVDPTDPEDRWHREAFQDMAEHGYMSEGTFELVGPKVQGNPEQYTAHHLIPHRDADVIRDAPRTFDGLVEFMRTYRHEGIVWHHPDGRMAKIKRRDFA